MLLITMALKGTRKSREWFLFINRISEKFDTRTRVIIVETLNISLINYCVRTSQEDLAF